MEYVEVDGKKKIHHGFWIFVGCCFISAGFFALSASIVSVFIGYASAGVNAGPGDWSFNTMLGKITGIAMSPILGRWLQGGPKMFKFACIFSLACIAGKFYGFAAATELWQVYVLGFIAGSGSGVLMSMITPNLIGNWFAPKYRGKFMGIATAFTGVGTFVWAPTFAAIVNALGYRMGYVICASTMVVMCLPWILFVFKYRPEEKGLQPYGFDPNEPVEEKVEASSFAGMSHTKVFKTPAFYVVTLTMIALSLGMGFNSYQTPIAKEILMPTGMDAKAAAMVGATMVSTAAVGNMLSKIIFGWFKDRIGSRISILFFSILFLCCFLIYIFLGKVMIMLYVAAFILGTHNCLASVGFPLVVRELFGNYDFGKIYAYIGVGTSIGGALGNSMAGWVYQWTGSYINSCWYGVVVALIVIIFGQMAIGFIGKVEWDHQPEDAKAEAAA